MTSEEREQSRTLVLEATDKEKQEYIGEMGIQGKRVARQHENCENEKTLQRYKGANIKTRRERGGMLKTFHVSTDKGASKRVKCVYANARSIVSKEKRAELELIAKRRILIL